MVPAKEQQKVTIRGGIKMNFQSDNYKLMIYCSGLTKKCVFPVTCQKILRPVGRKNLLFFNFYFFFQEVTAKLFLNFASFTSK